MAALPAANPVGPAPTPHQAPAPAAAPDRVSALMHDRRQASPRRLIAPGPDAAQTQSLFLAAAQAPDHGCLVPWRFVLVPPQRREALGDAFAAALRERDPLADAASLAQARDKAAHAPFLALAIARERDAHADAPDQDAWAAEGVPAHERLVSLGCAIQNLLLVAHAQGYGAGLVSGRALESRALRRLFTLDAGERAVCFIAVGTVQSPRPARARPLPRDFVATL